MNTTDLVTWPNSFDMTICTYSAGIKCKLISSSLLQNDHIYLDNTSKCATVESLAQKLLRQYTFRVVERERERERERGIHKLTDIPQ